jgi:hypothetical protein
MSVTSWDVAMDKLYQNTLTSPKDAEDFCIGCPFVGYDSYMGTTCEWNWEPGSGCPREEEFRDAFEG